jgi:hypothetical protein
VKDKTNTEPVQKDPQSQAERRRTATVVHDDRGNASVEWQDAPPDYDRPVLEILDDAPPGAGRNRSFDPYGRSDVPGRSTPPARAGQAGRPQRTDLRKLSEWIKMMRELEARKRNSGGTDDEGKGGE